MNSLYKMYKLLPRLMHSRKTKRNFQWCLGVNKILLLSYNMVGYYCGFWNTNNINIYNYLYKAKGK